MYANQLVNWHLINMGSPKDFHSIHFHGQTFLMNDHHRQGVYPLLPGLHFFMFCVVLHSWNWLMNSLFYLHFWCCHSGSFATLQMWPSKPGLWMLESEVGISQQRGMQTLFLVLDNGIKIFGHLHIWKGKLIGKRGKVLTLMITHSPFYKYWNNKTSS